ncbi:Stearoyl-CoA desaturase 5 [Halotydeus destructor]|nr:Stearoyl-CoA desaturase 5 [Halotydeus destructor]
MSLYPRYVLAKSCKRQSDRLHYWFVDNGFFRFKYNFFTISFAILHLFYFVAFYRAFEIPTYTFIWGNFLGMFIAIGITCGAHLLWSHRAYEAKWPLRVLYMIGHTMSGQFTLYKWASEHRVHHKWSDTDGDPHNPSRGFLFAHIGWIFRPEHPEMVTRSKTLDYSDLWRDPIVKFQHENYPLLFIVFGIVIPIAFPVYMWNETWWASFLLVFVGRIVIVAHIVLLINSAAHMFGDKPYSTKIAPTDNGWVAAITFGSGYHNYHHMFPSDYASSEADRRYNLARAFINLMARVGQAHNLKTASQEVVDRTKEKVLTEKNVFYGLKENEETPNVYDLIYKTEM